MSHSGESFLTSAGYVLPTLVGGLQTANGWYPFAVFFPMWFEKLNTGWFDSSTGVFAYGNVHLGNSRFLSHV